MGVMAANVRGMSLCAGLAALLLSPAVASGEVASALLREAEELLPGETINFLNNTAVNHVGGYSCTLSTTGTGTISRIWGDSTGGPGSLLRSEAIIGNLEQTSFESFFGMSDAGQLGYGATTNEVGGGATGLDGVWLDDLVVLNEEDPVPSLPGQYSVFNSRPTASGAGTPVWVGGITPSQGGSTQNRCLFSGLGSTVLIMGGDSLPGVAEPVSTATSGIDFDFRVSRFDTNWINLIGVTSGTTNDGVMVINGDPIIAGGGMMRENEPVPAVLGGLPGELWDNFDYLGINEAGDFFVTGDTSAADTEDEFVSKNGEIILREGDSLDLSLVPVTISGAIEGGYMNGHGDWAVAWDVDDGAGNIEVLICNGEIVLAEGDRVDWSGDGVIDENDNDAILTDFTGLGAVTVGGRSNGYVKVYFTADIDVGGTGILEGFFCLEVQVDTCPWDCGDGDDNVGVVDFLAMLAQWGQSGAPCDFDNDGVSVVDFLALLANWGPCP
ncbi:MAG: hypothetical protein ACYSU7_05615 [Planctomycetota bacterium]|jgi:hypothetical protein